MLTVLSLFDWISCWQVALNNIGIKNYKYFASEINQDAIKVTQSNFPNTIQVWDIEHIVYENWKYKPDKLFFWKRRLIDWAWQHEWVHFTTIDLLIWGSPCQWFSYAWKQLNFNDARSKLFFEYVRILKEVKPRYFLLENVKMKKEYQDIISEQLFWIQPCNINSSKLSWQLRNRFYWVWELQEDWTYKQVNIEQPEDLWIKLKDIITSWYVDRDKSRAILESESRPLVNKENMVHRYYNTWFTTIIYKDKELSEYAKSRVKERLWDKTWVIYNWFNDIVRDDKSWTLLSWSAWWSWKATSLVIQNDDIRYFNQTELERLQTLPEWYTKCVSRNKAASLIGNGWTVKVIEYIFKHLKLT